MSSVGLYATAREFMERALSTADALGRRREMATIGERLCEVIEQEDFAECYTLDRPQPVLESPEP